jgi:LETM1 and EF-hand domain-containing protein 1
MLTRIDGQLEEYDTRVGSSLQMISCDPQGRISLRDLERALAVIRHKPNEEVGQAVTKKLDVDRDGYVILEHVLDLVKEEGLGAWSQISIVMLLIVCDIKAWSSMMTHKRY